MDNEYVKSAVGWAKSNPKAAMLTGAAVALGTLAFIGGALIINAMVYGLIIVAAFGVIFFKMTTSKSPIARKIADLMRKYSLVTDAAVTAVAFMAGPSGVTGAIGAGIACLATSIILGLVQTSEEELEDRAMLTDLQLVTSTS